MNELVELIWQLEHSLLSPKVRQDVDRLDSLLADDFREVGSSGRIYSRGEVIHHLLQHDEEVVWSVSNFEVKLLSADVALATYRAKKEYRNKAGLQYSFRSSIWRRDEAEWKMAFHQGTVVEDTDKA